MSRRGICHIWSRVRHTLVPRIFVPFDQVIRGYTKVYNGIHGYIGVYKSLPGYPWVYKGMQGYIWVYVGM